MTLALFPTILAAFGCIVYIFRGSAFGKGNLDFRGRVSRHILIDVMVLFAASFFYFGYPDVPLANVVSTVLNWDFITKIMLNIRFEFRTTFKRCLFI